MIHQARPSPPTIPSSIDKYLPISVRTSQEIFYVNRETNIVEDHGIEEVVETNETAFHHDSIP